MNYSFLSVAGEDGIGEMARTLGELTVEVFEELVERTVDRRFEVWLTQLMDSFEGVSDESGDELRPEFAASLRRSLEQARVGEGVDLGTFRHALVGRATA